MFVFTDPRQFRSLRIERVRGIHFRTDQPVQQRDMTVMSF